LLLVDQWFIILIIISMDHLVASTFNYVHGLRAGTICRIWQDSSSRIEVRAYFDIINTGGGNMHVSIIAVQFIGMHVSLPVVSVVAVPSLVVIVELDPLPLALL
jgi:hypothetical protein